jgi:hypothetical protein
MQLTAEENRLVREGLTQLADEYEKMAKSAEKIADDHAMAHGNAMKDKIVELRGRVAHETTKKGPRK